ncbi:uncharacterized protein LOC142240494 [Haematobia irritans]|uniref:uncharacterized protein LOC142240494 n=1 Tax=Haematobia irritans TaxID=7368 RepID=UPI003F4FAA2D
MKLITNMALSPISKQCILMALFCMAIMAFYSYNEINNMVKNRSFETSDWSNFKRIVRNLTSETGLIRMYFFFSLISAPLFIFGVIKRNILATIPLVLLSPLPYIFNEGWWRMRGDWIVVYISIFASIILIGHPLYCLYREIFAEKYTSKAKLSRV